LSSAPADSAGLEGQPRPDPKFGLVTWYEGKQAVNAALMALNREGAIRQAGRRQPYTAVDHPQADETA